MKNLTKPLGVPGKSQLPKKMGLDNFIVYFYRIPFVFLSFALLFGTGLVATIWVAISNDPNGGQPIVTVRIIEPKFDSAERSVNVVSIASEARSDAQKAEPASLTELISTDDNALTPLNPDDVRIYDPSDAREYTQHQLKLSTVANKELVEKSRHGFLPRIGASGEKPLVAYSRPARNVAGRKGRIALIVGGLGLNEETSQRTLADLPAETTLAFVPYADRLLDWMSRARARGHELLLQIPLEPFDYPNNDPGPKTLLVDAEWSDNEDKLHWLMSRMTNYVGIVNYMGARFSASPEALRPFLKEIQKRGLLYVDDGSTPLSRSREIAGDVRVAYAQSSIVLDSLLTAEDIDARLLELESLARDKGVAIGIASAFPVTIERLKRWAKGAERRGITLTPISATLEKSSF